MILYFIQNSGEGVIDIVVRILIIWVCFKKNYIIFVSQKLVEVIALDKDLISMLAQALKQASSLSSKSNTNIHLMGGVEAVW